MDGPVWVPCEDCGEYFCRVHGKHAADCDCPPIEEWEALWTPTPGNHCHRPKKK